LKISDEKKDYFTDQFLSNRREEQTMHERGKRKRIENMERINKNFKQFAMQRERERRFHTERKNNRFEKRWNEYRE